MFKFAFLLILLVSNTFALAAPLKYTSPEGEEFQGFFLKGKKKDAPAILMIHNWMGVSDETQTQAKRFQDLGYAVMAADIYGANIRPQNAKEAGELAGKYKSDRNLFRKRLLLALETLKKQPGIQAKKIAVVGYCFGGTGAIELARSGADIKGVISFHGGLDSPNPSDGKNIKAKLLILHGANDPYVPEKDLSAFEAELKASQIDYSLVKFGNTVHSFTDKTAGNDPQKGAAYQALSDKRSLAMAKDFLSEIF